MTPIRSDVEEWLEHEGPFMGERMRQDERPRTGVPKIWAAPPPMPDKATIIDNIDIEGTRPPGSAAPPSRRTLDPLQHLEQRFRREARVEQGHGIDVSRLAGATDRRSLIERRDSSDGNISAFDFAQSALDCAGGCSPRAGTICTKTYQYLATRQQLRSHPVTPMLLKQPSSRCFREAALSLRPYCCHRDSNGFLSNRAHRSLH